eukprot:749536-Hanusia_phi.AAC.1
MSNGTRGQGTDLVRRGTKGGGGEEREGKERRRGGEEEKKEGDERWILEELARIGMAEKVTFIGQ